MHGWVMAALSRRWRFIEGLGEDMVGYIFPRSNAVDVPTPAHFANDPGDVDRFGCGHSDDGEAAAEAAGDLLNDAVLSLLPPSHKRAGRVRVGRYVWPDGSLHRNPIGEGRLGCDSASSGFVAAPDGGAIAVWVLSPGSATFKRGAGKVYRLQDTPTFGPAHRNAQWMDVRGQPQSAPGMQTRGVILGSRERVWLDVFPETTGLTALPPRKPGLRSTHRPILAHLYWQLRTSTLRSWPSWPASRRLAASSPPSRARVGRRERWCGSRGSSRSAPETKRARPRAPA